jgi:hypothetical protein
MPNYSGIWTEQAVMQANGAGNWPNAPGAPTIGTATVLGATSVSVAFTAPTFAGIPATITSYTVTSSPGGLTGTGASSPITVSGLTEGTPYTFTVRATNASGTGPASAASNSVTPVQLNYVEEVFSTYLWTGNASTQTITNSINLSANGGLVWIKRRDGAVSGNYLATTVGGTSNYLQSNSINPYETSVTTRITSFNTDGFSLGAAGSVNSTGALYAGWTFRKQPKFFDIVTWSGNDVSNRQIAHNLGSVPGCIIARATGTSNDWAVYHRSLGNTKGMYLNLTQAQETNTTWGNTTPTSSVFTTNLNGAGNDYIAYLFAHDAGGFGTSGTDNVISCGSFSAPSGNATVTIGYEPQYILWKRTDASQNWNVYDNMRGWAQKQVAQLYPNLTQVEDIYTGSEYFFPTATGFQLNSSFGLVGDYIYITIRRGPMKVPTSATTVFSPITNSATTGTVNTTGFPVDMGIVRWRTGEDSNFLRSRLQGVSSTEAESGAWLRTNTDDGESTTGGLTRLWNNTGFQTTSGYSGYSTVYWNFGRAPGFFDEVCYTGTGSARTVTHNLTVVPELMIVKRRSTTGTDWAVYSSALGATQAFYLNQPDAAVTSSTFWNNTAPTSSVFTVNTAGGVNLNGGTFVAYLFATCAGVSKVGSYTGTGTTQTINCGFAAGSRFVMIKRTDSTGDWYVWDSARGIVAGNDPYLLLNSPAVEVTNTDYVDTAATGFEISSTAPAAINANGGTFIFLAIA